MKKVLLTSILSSILVAPAFCAFPASDMNNDGQVENHIVSSNMRPVDAPKYHKSSASQNSLASDMGGIRSHRQMVDQKNSQAKQGSTKRQLGRISEEDMRAPRGDSPNNSPKKEHPHKAMQKHSSNHDKKKVIQKMKIKI